MPDACGTVTQRVVDIENVTREVEEAPLRTLYN